MRSHRLAVNSKPNLWQSIMSVFAAFLGVQSDKNRRRDFAGGSIKTYIIIGVVATIALVATLIAIVNWVLS